MRGNGGPSLDHQRRLELGDAFKEGGEHYEKVRPSYPAEALEWIMLGTAANDGAGTSLSALDVGAGTGKFTELLVGKGWEVTALDPSSDMLAQLRHKFPRVEVLEGTAENIQLVDGSIDLAVAAQSWHWCEPIAASSELARVLQPHGVLGLIWNQLDVQVPWVHRLARIMHAGDVHKADFVPTVGKEFKRPVSQEFHWEDQLTPEDLIELVKSRSYYLKAGPDIRQKVLGNLSWYLYEHLGHQPGELLSLPYITQSWRVERN